MVSITNQWTLALDNPKVSAVYAEPAEGAAGEVHPFSNEGTMSLLAPFPARWNTIPISLAINSNCAGKSFNSYSQHKKQRKPGRLLSWEGLTNKTPIKPVSKERLSGQLGLSEVPQLWGARVPATSGRSKETWELERCHCSVWTAFLPRHSLAQNLWHSV